MGNVLMFGIACYALCISYYIVHLHDVIKELKMENMRLRRALE